MMLNKKDVLLIARLFFFFERRKEDVVSVNGTGMKRQRNEDKELTDSLRQDPLGLSKRPPF